MTGLYVQLAENNGQVYVWVGQETPELKNIKHKPKVEIRKRSGKEPLRVAGISYSPLNNNTIDRVEFID